MADDITILAVMAIIPLLFAFWLATGAYRSLFAIGGRISDVLSVLSITAILLFGLIVSPWVMGSYWLRPVVTLLLIIGWGRWIFNKFPGYVSVSTKIGRVSQGFLCLIGILTGGIALMGFKGQLPPPASVDLAFPLKDRNFVIGQGGSSIAVNLHGNSEAQKYAVDIVAMNVFGRNKSGFGLVPNSAYAIWEAPVISPCEGRIVWKRDGLNDWTGPSGEKGLEHLAGNAVAIECGAITVFLAHMRQDSIAVQQGQNVKVGDPIGLVGNSGKTSEPHLHIHVENGAYDGERSDNQGIAILFEGDFPVRNDLFRK